MRSKLGHRILVRGVPYLLLYLCWVGFSAFAAEPFTAQAILDHMKANTDRIEDLDATITIQTYKDGEVPLTQTRRLRLLQPDKMRQEFFTPDYLAGNVTLIAGDVMWMYIAASDQWTRKDLSALSAAEQPWLVFRNILREVRSDLDDYHFERMDDTEGDAYHLRGTPANKQAIYGRIDLWIDSTTFVPVHRELYDVDGKLLVDARLAEASFVDEIAFLPLRIEGYDADGTLQNVILYESIVLNQGLDEAIFAPPEEEGTHG